MLDIRFSHALFLIGTLIVLLSSCSSDGEPDPVNPVIDPADKLPIVEINTLGNVVVDEPKVSAEMLITQNTDTIYDGRTGIEFRGASSQALFPKKSYGLELWDENDEDTKASIFDMPEEEDWILHGPYSDKSLLRNKLIYDLSRSMGRYASRTQIVDLKINDAALGVYIFMEKLKRDGERIDINKLKEDENEGEDVTGGYILKIDKTAGNNLGEGYNSQNSFTSAYAPVNASNDQSIYFLYEYPDAEDITNPQRDYISSYIQDFEAALASDDFADPELGYRPYVDVSSFIDFFILNEISNNVDGYRLSTFMHKDKNGPLTMGPIWDFNLAFGNADYCNGGASDVWSFKFNERCPNDFWLAPFWWERLMEDPAFVTELQSRWTALRVNILSTGQVLSMMDQDIAMMTKAGAINENFSIWSVLGSYVWPNNFVGSSYDAEVQYMKDWITNRLQWMDGAIMAL